MPIRVLLNVTYPLVAFARDWQSAGAPLEFLDHTALAVAFVRRPHYTVLSAATLGLTVTDAVTIHLAATEMEQLSYWKPSCIGDVIFNYWD